MEYLDVKMLKIFLALLINSFLVYFLLDSFVEYNFDSYVDVFSYIEYGEIIKESFEAIIDIPSHYWLRIVLPLMLLTGKIGDDSLMLYAVSNTLMNYAATYVFFKGFFRYVGVEIQGWSPKYACALIIFSPGIIFTTSTMKPEWPTILILGAALWIISKKSFLSLVFSSVICIFARPSSLISSIALWGVKKWIKRPTLLDIFFVCMGMFLLVALAYGEFFDTNFFISPHYFYVYNDGGIRDLVQVETYSDAYKMPLKYAYSLFLESNVFVDFDWRNPESINTINGFFMSALKIIILIHFLIFNGYKQKLLNNSIVVYIGITAPPIMLTGFYQTRYLICGDLVLLAYVYFALKSSVFCVANSSGYQNFSRPSSTDRPAQKSNAAL